jgi:cytochrome c oxidase subunit 4
MRFPAAVRTYAAVYAALLVLAGATTAVAYVDLGAWNVAVALAIAGAKAVLVALYFMHLRTSPRVAWLFAGAGVFWLAILLALAAADLSTRGWTPSPEVRTEDRVP